MDESFLRSAEAAIAVARRYPFVASVVVAMALLLMLFSVMILLIGTICSWIDDTKVPERLGALVRIGRSVGTVFRGTGREWAIVLFGGDRVRDSASDRKA
jgi:hypothetical protein